MTIQTPCISTTFTAGAEAVRRPARGAAPWRAARPARAVETHADLPAPTLLWMIEALVLGPDRPDARPADEDAPLAGCPLPTRPCRR